MTKTSEVWRKIENHRKLGEQISKINQRITQLKNTAYAESSQVIDLATGMAEINLEDEMRKEFAGKKIRELRKKRSELIAKQRDLEVDLEKDYERLKRSYAKDLLTMKLYFKKFIRELKKLETLWRCMIGDGDRIRNIYRTIWALGNLLGKSENIEPLPPYHRWTDEMRRSFTLLENYLKEAEKHGN